MYHKFDVTENLFFLHSAFLEELNTALAEQSVLFIAPAAQH
jgi:hypothetical protein